MKHTARAFSLRPVIWLDWSLYFESSLLASLIDMYFCSMDKACQHVYVHRNVHRCFNILLRVGFLLCDLLSCSLVAVSFFLPSPIRCIYHILLQTLLKRKYIGLGSLKTGRFPFLGLWTQRSISFHMDLSLLTMDRKFVSGRING
jgi:hypothetical protein